MTGWGELFQGASQPLYRDFAIAEVTVGKSRRPVTTRAILRSPFHTLRLFRTKEEAPTLLVVPPLSGHFPVLMRDVVVGLLPDFQVVVLDWANVRHVPVSEGTFGFDDNVRAIAEAILRLGPSLSVLALCQGGVPGLAAVADLARRGPAVAPAALVLVAAPIDPMANPTPVVRLIRGRSQAWFDVVPLGRVAQDHDGRGRWVYPAELQLAGLEVYRERYGKDGSELARKFEQDDGADPQLFPFADLYTSVMDIDAQHFTENIGRVYLRRELARGELRYDGRAVDAGAIHDTALLTVEGTLDDIAAPGQTLAAHGLCARVPDDRHASLVVPGAGHFSLFHGRSWREQVLPVVRDYCRRHGNGN
jgi:poly(3-hydroxybutyrate) depolymerase